jgi:hypothetical protein
MRSSLGQAQSFEVVNDVSHGGPIDGQPLGDVKVAQWAQKGPRLQTSGINARNLLSSTATRHTENVALGSAHMAERLRLFLLGEAVLTTGTAISESATDPFTLVAGAAAFAVVAYLWALYFGGSEYIHNRRPGLVQTAGTRTAPSRSVSRETGDSSRIRSGPHVLLGWGGARFDAQHVDVDQAGLMSVELDAVDDSPPHRVGDLPRRGGR